MSRRNIVFSEGEYYHLYSRGVDKRIVFLENSDCERFLKLLYCANSDTSVHLSDYRQGVALTDIQKGKSLTAIGAWCIMPNHFHILVRETKENGISEFIQKLLTSYSMYFNIKNQRKGSLFEKPFHARHLSYDEYLKYQYAYIHLNPIGIIDKGWKEKKIDDKAKAKKFLQEYTYSSYKDYAREKREESVILHKEVFPEYFESLVDFDDMIDEWIGFEEKVSQDNIA